MTWVKICGITSLEDAQAAVAAGADALGFVFYEQSLRKMTPQSAAKIVATLPSEIEKVGVFVDHSAGQASEIAALVGLTGVQLAQNSIMERQNRLAGWPKIILTISSDRLERGEPAANEDMRGLADVFLVDSSSVAQPGGTGRTFDWNRARPAVQALSAIRPVIVAGGLTPSNVTDAMRLLRPWGVDVASGVEARPGKKNPDKVRAFVEAVRKADKQQ